jgi:hypothetical protein
MALKFFKLDRILDLGLSKKKDVINIPEIGDIELPDNWADWLKKIVIPYDAPQPYIPNPWIDIPITPNVPNPWIDIPATPYPNQPYIGDQPWKITQPYIGDQPWKIWYTNSADYNVNGILENVISDSSSSQKISFNGTNDQFNYNITKNALLCPKENSILSAFTTQLN